MRLLLPLVLGVLPALAFLAALMSLDSYKRVRPGWVLTVMMMGMAAAAASYVINMALLQWSGVELPVLVRFIAPVIEEAAKGIWILVLLRAHRIAFLVDAAICGFGIGTGFAIVENLYYLAVLGDTSLAVWVVRGFGTAIMHGGTTAIFALVARSLLDHHELSGSTGATPSPWLLLPGFLSAVLIHSVFNHFLLNPILSTIGVLLVLPPLVALVFRRGEQSLRQWLDVGLDADTRLLDLIHTGDFVESKVGLYLQSLRQHIPGEIVADMLCYLRLHLELAMRAKGLLLMRESGFKVQPDPEIGAGLQELSFLAGRIGPTGRLAMAPFIRMSDRDLWQISLLSR